MQLESVVQWCSKPRDEQCETETNNVSPHLMFSTQLFFNASCQKRIVVIIMGSQSCWSAKICTCIEIDAEKEINAYKLLVELVKL